MALLPSCAENLVLPVILRNTPVIFHRPLLAFMLNQVVLLGICRKQFILQLHKLIRIQHWNCIGDLLKSETSVILELRFSNLSFLGRDNNDTVSTTGTINGSGRSIFQHFNGFSVGRVNGSRNSRIFYRKPVNNI